MAFGSSVYGVVPVPIEKAGSNTYNPNSVAPPKPKLLYESIKQDGCTIPAVCYHDESKGRCVLVDGFNRCRTVLGYPDIYERKVGRLSASAVNKPLDQGMASTIRHNRARGTHNVDLTSNMVKEFHELSHSDSWIARHLEMDRNEVLRLKQTTGLAALSKGVPFGQA